MKTKTFKLILIFMSMLLIVCIILLVNTVKQCFIPSPKVIVGNIEPNAQPHSTPAIPIYYSFNNHSYKKSPVSISNNDVESQIGTTSKSDEWPSLPVYKIKGNDANKSIAIKISDTDFYQAFNHKYWQTQLPKIIIYSLLILLLSAGIIMISINTFRSQRI